ncbi:hypothetical protein PGT21_010406 [Puccinia graminis f. sp. tritici]|nr:hypothetical protein PGT21_010406 [Puccinia graminis f. sp. tritici]
MASYLPVVGTASQSSEQHPSRRNGPLVIQELVIIILDPLMIGSSHHLNHLQKFFFSIQNKAASALRLAVAVASAPLNKRTAQPLRAWCRSWIIVVPLVDIDMDLPLNASQSYNDAGVLDKPKKSIFFCWCSWRGNRRLRQLLSRCYGPTNTVAVVSSLFYPHLPSRLHQIASTIAPSFSLY